MSESPRRILIVDDGHIPASVVRTLIERTQLGVAVGLDVARHYNFSLDILGDWGVRTYHLAFAHRYAYRIKRQQRLHAKRFGDHSKWTVA